MDVKDKRLLIYETMELVKEIKESNVDSYWDYDEFLKDLSILLNDYPLSEN